MDCRLGLRAHRPRPPAEAGARAVSARYSQRAFPAERRWPRVSVVVCTYNGARTLGDCLAGVEELDYPDFETIVVDDGSTERPAEIAADYRRAA